MAPENPSGVQMMNIDGLKLLKELDQRLEKDPNEKSQTRGVVSAQSLGSEFHASLKNLTLELEKHAHTPSDFSSNAVSTIIDNSLLWKVSSLCGAHECFLDPKYVREQVKNIHNLSLNPAQAYRDDIWSNQLLYSWLNSHESCMVLLQGDYGSIQRSRLFGIDLAEHIENQLPLAYMAYKPLLPSSCTLPFQLDADQVLRHLAIQALQIGVFRPSTEFVLDIVVRFSRAATCNDWFSILAMILCKLPGINFIIDLGATTENEIQAWPDQFEALFEKVRIESPQTIIRVMFITCRPLNNISKTTMISLIKIGKTNLPLGYTGSRPMRPCIPKNLTKLSDVGFGRLDQQNKVKSTSDNNQAENKAVSKSTLSNNIEYLSANSIGQTKDKYNRRPKSRQEFEIAIFCALTLEADAVDLLFDNYWDEKYYGKMKGDENWYTVGAIGNQNIVLVHLPEMGKKSAASAASSCRLSFPGLKLGLVVGICGGVPFGANGVERLLGDVVISDGLIQYDFGRQYPGHFEKKRTVHESLSRPGANIRGFLAKLRSRRTSTTLIETACKYLDIFCKYEDANGGGMIYKHPGVENDVLQDPTYLHKHRDAAQCPMWDQACGQPDGVCEDARVSSCGTLGCDSSSLVQRRRVQVTKSNVSHTWPMIHIGTMASGDKVMKSGEERDKIAKEENIIAFEMEGAGVWEHFPCLIIKGICDYADCHKTKQWQSYAAATAAACTKTLLEQWDE